MTNNPYESPLSVDVSDSGRKQGIAAPFRFVGVGLFAGSILGGTFGAGHACVVAFVAILFQLSGNAPFASPAGFMLEGAIVFLLAATIAGALVGLPIGLTLGLVLGLWAGVSGPQARRPFLLCGIASATFAGAIAAGVFAFDLTQTPRATLAFSTMVVTSGTLAGFFCGLCLVRGLAKLAWPSASGDRPPKGIDPRL